VEVEVEVEVEAEAPVQGVQAAAGTAQVAVLVPALQA